MKFTTLEASDIRKMFALLEREDVFELARLIANEETGESVQNTAVLIAWVRFADAISAIHASGRTLIGEIAGFLELDQVVVAKVVSTIGLANIGTHRIEEAFAEDDGVSVAMLLNIVSAHMETPDGGYTFRLTELGYQRGAELKAELMRKAGIQ